jgi:hypothetical protein
VFAVVEGFFLSWGKALGGIAAAVALAMEGEFAAAGQALSESWGDATDTMGKAMEDAGKAGEQADESIRKVWHTMGDVEKKINDVDQATKNANKTKLKIIDPSAEAELEKLRKKQADFFTDLERANARATQDKLKALDVEKEKQLRQVEELKFAGEDKVRALNAVDQWYANARQEIQSGMLEKLGVLDDAYRARKTEMLEREAEQMRNAGLTELQVDQYVKTSLLQQQLDYLAQKNSLVDEQYLTDTEKSNIQYEEDLIRLQLALENRAITEDQYRTMTEQANIQH